MSDKAERAGAEDRPPEAAGRDAPFRLGREQPAVPGTTTPASGERERQHAAVADLALAALAGAPIDRLAAEACRRVAECLGCPLAEVLSLDRATGDFVLRAGHGWPPEHLGRRVPQQGGSLVAAALGERDPLAVEDLARDPRFSAPAVLDGDGIVSGLAVRLGTGDEPWGVFAVHDWAPRAFADDEVAFLRSIAGLFALALGRDADEREREESAARLETVLDAAGIGTWMWMPETDDATWDARLDQIAGLPEDAPRKGGSFFRLIHPDDRQRVSDALQRMLREGGDYNEQFRLVLPSGETRWIVGLGSEMPDGSRLRQVFGVNFDVTERVRSEARLSESERRRKLAIEAASLGTWEWRPGEDHLIWDEGMFRMTGLAPAETVPLEVLREHIPAEDWDRRAARLEAALAEHGGFEYSLRFDRDGDERWITSAGRVFEDEGGTRVIGIAFDTTERRREEERRKMLMAELDHRVKNILANVNAIARQTGRTRHDPAEFIEALEGRLSAMADAHSLLSAAHWEGVSLAALIEAELSPYVSDREARVTVDGPDLLLSPKAAQSLSLFLHELITNAAKYGALRHGDGAVSLRWTVGDVFELTWAERSPEAILQPTRRGFGLSVIEDMTASDLSGEVTLDFRPDGLLCRLVAPLAGVQAAGRSAAFADVAPLREWKAETGEAPEPAAEALKILIVEDVWTVAMHLKDLLEEAGHEVLGPGARLEEALALAEMDEIDAAILDVRLNEELVFPVAERLAERGIPFGFATGYADSGMVPPAFGDRPLISKPYGGDSVGRLVGLLAAERRAAR